MPDNTHPLNVQFFDDGAFYAYCGAPAFGYAAYALYEAYDILHGLQGTDGSLFPVQELDKMTAFIKWLDATYPKLDFKGNYESTEKLMASFLEEFLDKRRWFKNTEQMISFFEETFMGTWWDEMLACEREAQTQEDYYEWERRRLP